MKLLLDHCVDRGLARSFPGHEVQTAQDMGWERLKNGDLLAHAASVFDVVITTDQNLRYQQNLATLPISVLELNSPNSRLGVLQSLSPSFEAALAQAKNHRFVVLYADGRIDVIA
jgi:predicted nuclease of predicted toxin-antitoxin system